MKAGELHTWAREPGIESKVALVIARDTVLSSPLMMSETPLDMGILVRVLDGPYRGMYAIVDPANLTPLQSPEVHLRPSQGDESGGAVA